MDMSNNNLVPVQADVIKSIENIISKSIPIVSNFTEYTFGMKIENNLITNLSLFYAGLETLPPLIGNLNSLKTLNLSNNNLKNLPETIVNLNNLRTLNLSFNYLEFLPESLCDMASLRELKLFENNIKELPQNLGNFERLRVLDLRFNSLVKLPESIGDVKPLKSLQLSCNSLKNLPASVVNLKYMKNLNVSGNQISDLDPNIVEVLKKIEKKKNLPEILNLRDNPIYAKFPKLKKRFGLEKIDYYIELTIPQSWKGKLRRVLDIYGLSKYRDKIFDAIKYRFPMIKHYVKDENNIDVGLSKLGGNPDVPEDFEWPFWDNRPLSFLLQVNLDDFIKFEKNPFTAKNGMLYFFYDPLQEDWGADFGKNEGAWRVIYIKEDKSNFIRLSNPSKIREYTFPTCLVTFYQDIHFPCHLLSGEESDEIRYTPDFFINSPLKYDFFFRDPYVRFRLDFFENDFELGYHILFGYPDEIQELGKMDGWCQLLQLDEDSMLRWTWGHHGRIHFLIKENDLKRNYFDGVHLIMDCY